MYQKAGFLRIGWISAAKSKQQVFVHAYDCIKDSHNGRQFSSIFFSFLFDWLVDWRWDTLRCYSSLYFSCSTNQSCQIDVWGGCESTERFVWSRTADMSL